MSNVADSLRRRVLSHTESSMIFATNELLSLCEAIDKEFREGQERMRERAAKLSESCQIDDGYVDTRQIWTNTTATGIARAIRALEVGDG